LIRIPAAWYVTAGALALAGWQALSAYSARTELAELHAAAAQETVRRIESRQEVTRYANQSRARDMADELMCAGRFITAHNQGHMRNYRPVGAVDAQNRKRMGFHKSPRFLWVVHLIVNRHIHET
jgi:hypothetical protein